MPVILSDEVLIPPSMRASRAPPRRYYEVNTTGGTTTTIIEPARSSASSTTIELPPHHHTHGVITPPRSPLIIHQETTRIIPRSREYDDYCSCESDDEYDYQFEDEERRRRYTEKGNSGAPPRRNRSHSVGFPAGPALGVISHFGQAEYERRMASRHEASENSYYLEDGGRYNNYTQGHPEHRHWGPHVLPGHRHPDEPGYNESEKHHRRVRRLAQAGLAVAAIGAAKELHDHRKARSRSPSSSRSRSNSPSHRGRKIAGAALGATAAGIAAHKLRDRRRSRSSSADSRLPYSSDDEKRGHHKVKVAAATAATIGGAALAAHHIRKNRRGSRSRSRSSSRERSPERRRSHTGRHIAAAALGGTAAGLAHHHYKHHREDVQRPKPTMRRSHSEGSFRRRPGGILRRGRSPSPHKTSKLKKGAAIATAAVIAKEALDHYRNKSRSRSRNRSSSRSRSSSRERRHHRHPHSRPHHYSRSPSPRNESMPKRVMAAMKDAANEGTRQHHSRRGSINETARLHGGGVSVPESDRRREHHHI